MDSLSLTMKCLCNGVIKRVIVLVCGNSCGSVQRRRRPRVRKQLWLITDGRITQLLTHVYIQNRFETF